MNVLTANSVEVLLQPKKRFVWLTKGTLVRNRYIPRKNRERVTTSLPVEIYF
ncbi:hypothetical protein J2S09_005053 [Bacillus fengqiuensis]|nr:hypothetical protein [Bacillus fengqiuensis]